MKNSNEIICGNERLNRFICGYVDCLIWTEEENLGDSLNLSDNAMSKIEADCRKFIEENCFLLSIKPDDYAQHGHDFWLTRNGHGAGFWDRGYGVVGNQLTKACESFGEQVAYEGDNGLVEVQ